MNPVLQFWLSALAACVMITATAISQTVPVSENLWRLLEQEDTDGR
jgi:hypothetical protein